VGHVLLMWLHVLLQPGIEVGQDQAMAGNQTAQEIHHHETNFETLVALADLKEETLLLTAAR
jgi:hypothetical protein